MRGLAGFAVLQGVLALIGVGSLRAVGLLSAGVRPAVLGLGPAWLVGTTLVGLGLVLLLVLSVPFTLTTIALVSVTGAGVAFVVAWHRGVMTERVVDAAAVRPSRVWLVRIAVATAAAYVGFGAYAVARAPIQADDARIWSLKGLALTYYDSLRPEIFLGPATAVSHHVYPLLQPVLEAALGRAMGQPELRLFHTELWLILIASIWTAAYLIWWRRERPMREQAGVVLLALVALTPAMVSNIWTGHADATGAVLLAAGAVALGLWIDGAANGHLWLAAILLGAAANTKDEDMIGAIVVLLAAGAVLGGRSHRARLRLWLAGVGVCAALILPWRIWTATHHLRDNVTPPLPGALTPRFLLDRAPELRRVGMAMVSHTVRRVGVGRGDLRNALRVQHHDPHRPKAHRVLPDQLRGDRGGDAVAIWHHADQPLVPDSEEHEPDRERVHGPGRVRVGAPAEHPHTHIPTSTSLTVTPSARRVAPVAIVTVAAFALVWSRLVPLGQSLWADEIKSVTAYIRPGPAAIYGHYVANDHILFELLTWASTALTGARSAAAYRFWGVVPGIAAAVILTRWLWRRIDPWVAALFALFATASPIYYTLCVDARGYGLGFLAASCVLIGADTYVRTGSRRALGLLGVAAVGGIWTLPVFALPVGAVLGLIALDRRDRLRLVLITAGLVAVASVTLYAPVLAQVLGASRQSFGQPLPWYGFASGPFTDLIAPELLVAVHGINPTSTLTLAPGASAPIPGTSGWATWIAAALVLVAFAVTVRVRRERFLAMACLVPAVFTYAVLDLARIHTVNRFASFLLLPLLALSAIGVVTMARWVVSTRAAAPVLAGLVAAGFAGFMFVRTDDMLRVLQAAPYENDKLIAAVVRTADIAPVVTNFNGGDTSYYLGRGLPRGEAQASWRPCSAPPATS